MAGRFDRVQPLTEAEQKLLGRFRRLGKALRRDELVKLERLEYRERNVKS